MPTNLRAARRSANSARAPAGDHPFIADRERLRHSPEFARLSQVTQVMAPNEPGHFYNRQSHSLQVARIGQQMSEAILANPDLRRAAAQVGGLEPAVVEAAALAHDLGHPPFGHDAEDELDQLLVAAGLPDGFEANAQTFRVVCKLAGSGNGYGLDLTRATLAAILKYPWLRHAEPNVPDKWGAYTSEADALAWARTTQPPENHRATLEAQVMDWADLVAYAVYDFEDFSRSGDIPLAQLAADSRERDRFLDLVTTRRRVPSTDHARFAANLDRLLQSCPLLPGTSDTRAARNALRCLANHLVAETIGALRIGGGDVGSATVTIEPEVEATILLVEGLTWHYVIASDLLAEQRAAQRQMIRTLYRHLASAAPGPDEATRLRDVADTIASLSEDAVIAACGALERLPHPV